MSNLRQTRDENFFTNVFETGLLSVITQSKYDWSLFQDEGNGYFYFLDQLPPTFVKTNGQQGRPSVPEWKKQEMADKGLFISTRNQPHPVTGEAGCMVYVKRIAKATR